MTRTGLLVSAAALVIACGIGTGIVVYRQATPSSQTAPTVEALIVQPRQPRTVSYFLAHRPALEQRYVECQDNRALELTDADCINAVHAKMEAGMDEILSSMPDKDK